MCLSTAGERGSIKLIFTLVYATIADQMDNQEHIHTGMHINSMYKIRRVNHDDIIHVCTAIDELAAIPSYIQKWRRSNAHKTGSVILKQKYEWSFKSVI